EPPETHHASGSLLFFSPQRHARRLLRARRKRPDRRAAEQSDELAPLHSITSSARASSVGGTSNAYAKDDGTPIISPFVLSTMANNSFCSASGTLNFAIVSSKSLQKAAHSLSVIFRCL